MKGFDTISALLAATAIGAASVPASAQDQTKSDFEVPRATAYQQVTQWPDWTGIWYPDWSLLFAGRERQSPKLTPAAQAKFDAYQESIKQNGPDQYAQAHCLPPGIPGVMQQPYPVEFLYSPDRVTIITEAYQQVRRIYLDGRSLPDDPDLFFNGNSIGQWEGNTLVVDSNGFSLQTNLSPGIEHSEKMTVHERIFLQAPGQLIDEMTISDPEVLTEPFVVRVAFKLDNEFPMREYVCAENNRLTSDGNGANIDLQLEDEEDPFAGLESK